MDNGPQSGSGLEHPFTDAGVKAVFDAFTPEARASLMQLRRWILEDAQNGDGVGTLVETLKWGQPAYQTQRPKSGTTLRLWCPKSGGFGIYMPCSTSLIPDFAAQFGDAFRYDGSRGVLFEAGAFPYEAPIRMLIHRAMRYHLG